MATVSHPSVCCTSGETSEHWSRHDRRQMQVELCGPMTSLGILQVAGISGRCHCPDCRQSPNLSARRAIPDTWLSSGAWRQGICDVGGHMTPSLFAAYVLYCLLMPIETPVVAGEFWHDWPACISGMTAADMLSRAGFWRALVHSKSYRDHSQDTSLVESGTLCILPYHHFTTETGTRSSQKPSVADIISGGCGPVVMDCVVKSVAARYSGPVYNLETRASYYFVDGIASHNCLCFPELHIQDDPMPGDKDFAYGLGPAA
jgi:hypothetical protein